MSLVAPYDEDLVGVASDTGFVSKIILDFKVSCFGNFICKTSL